MINRFRKAIKHDVLEADRRVVTAADYSIMVTGLPHHATADQVREHFSELYDLHELHSNYPLNCGCWGAAIQIELGRGRYIGVSKHAKPVVVSNLEHVGGDEDYLGSWVADVAIAHPIGKQIRTYLQNQAMNSKIHRAEVEVAKYSSNKITRKDNDDSHSDLPKMNENKLEALHSRAQARLNRLKRRQHKLNEDVLKRTESFAKSNRTVQQGKVVAANPLDRCVLAFVTFNNEESYGRCLDNYRTSNSSLSRAFQPKGLQFRDGFGKLYPLKVEAAPEPMEIIWENLENGATNRLLRRLLVHTITFGFLCVSFGLIYLAKVHNDKINEKFSTIPDCEANIPATYFGSYEALAGIKPRLHHYQNKTKTVCEPGQVYITYTHIEDRLPTPALHSRLTEGRNANLSIQYDYLSEPLLAPNSNRTRSKVFKVGNATYQLCTSPCVSTSDRAATCPLLPCLVPEIAVSGRKCRGVTHSSVINCYCHSRIHEFIEEQGFIEGLKSAGKDPLCSEFSNDYMLANSFLFLTSIFIIILNECMKTIMSSLTAFEHHHTKSFFTASLCFKMFLSQFLNTAIVLLVCNATLDQPWIKQLGIFNGAHYDFDRLWYPKVGFSVFVTMVINLVAPHATPLAYLWVVQPLTRWMTLKFGTVTTQEQLNQLYEGLEFEIERRYPDLLVTLFTTLLYSAGIPVLLPLAALNYALSYWIDKWMLLRLYQKPFFDQSLAVLAIRLLIVGLFLHILMTIWMFAARVCNVDHFAPTASHSSSYYEASSSRCTYIMTSSAFNPSMLGTFGQDEAGGYSGYNAFVNSLKTLDPFGEQGFIVRLTRLNIVPHVFVFLCMLAFALLERLGMRRAVLMLEYIAYFLSFGLLGTPIPGISPASGQRVIENFEREQLEAMPIPPYTGLFLQVNPDGSGKQLTDKEKQHGWYVEKNEWGHVLMRRFMGKGRHKGAGGSYPHEHGQRMLTWQAMSGLHSYQIHDNRLYRRALMASVFSRAKIIEHRQFQRTARQQRMRDIAEDEEDFEQRKQLRKQKDGKPAECDERGSKARENETSFRGHALTKCTTAKVDRSENLTELSRTGCIKDEVRAVQDHHADNHTDKTVIGTEEAVVQEDGCTLESKTTQEESGDVEFDLESSNEKDLLELAGKIDEEQSSAAELDKNPDAVTLFAGAASEKDRDRHDTNRLDSGEEGALNTDSIGLSGEQDIEIDIDLPPLKRSSPKHGNNIGRNAIPLLRAANL